MKTRNDYERALGAIYDRTPKAVLAAVAVSFMIRLDRHPGHLVDDFLCEWDILYKSGIVPQRPVKPRA